MHRKAQSLLFIVVVLLLATTSGSPAAPPRLIDISHRGPVWAYGQEVTGDPWFETRGDTLYYQGVYPYWPRRPRPDVPQPDTSTTAAGRAAERVWALAHRAADASGNRDEFIRTFTGVLDQHRDVVTSYTVDETSINAWFKDLNFFYSIKVGRQFPPEPVKMKDKETVRQEQEERFWKTYHSGCWVCWGVGYGVDVPRAWQPKTAAVIDSVHALMSTGATGDGLRAAISRLDGKNTPLECEDFLKDLLDPGRR